MTGSVNAAKVARSVGSKLSPEALLKQAVAGKQTLPSRPARKASMNGRTARTAAIATGTLVVGTAFGMMAAPKPQSGEAITRIEAALSSNHTEIARLNAEIERLGKAVAGLHDASEMARSDAQAVNVALTDRVGQLGQTLDKKVAGLTETIERSEQAQTARLVAAQADKHATVPTVPVTATPTASMRPDPTQTASITEPKPKSETIEAWAVREVYDGVALLEDRKRRLIEVARGDSVPGIGRVDTIERRGRMWVVVTKQGLIIPQMW